MPYSPEKKAAYNAVRRRLLRAIGAPRGFRPAEALLWLAIRGLLESLSAAEQTSSASTPRPTSLFWGTRHCAALGWRAQTRQSVLKHQLRLHRQRLGLTGAMAQLRRSFGNVRATVG